MNREGRNERISVLSIKGGPFEPMHPEGSIAMDLIPAKCIRCRTSRPDEKADRFNMPMDDLLAVDGLHQKAIREMMRLLSETFGWPSRRVTPKTQKARPA